MIQLTKRELATLFEIDKFGYFLENWRPKTRARLERVRLVDMKESNGEIRYKLSDVGRELILALMESKESV